MSVWHKAIVIRHPNPIMFNIPWMWKGDFNTGWPGVLNTSLQWEDHSGKNSVLEFSTNLAC